MVNVQARSAVLFNLIIKVLGSTRRAISVTKRCLSLPSVTVVKSTFGILWRPLLCIKRRIFIFLPFFGADSVFVAPVDGAEDGLVDVVVVVVAVGLAVGLFKVILAAIAAAIC